MYNELVGDSFSCIKLNEINDFRFGRNFLNFSQFEDDLKKKFGNCSGYSSGAEKTMCRSLSDNSAARAIEPEAMQMKFKCQNIVNYNEVSSKHQYRMQIIIDKRNEDKLIPWRTKCKYKRIVMKYGGY